MTERPVWWNLVLGVVLAGVLVGIGYGCDAFDDACTRYPDQQQC